MSLTVHALSSLQPVPFLLVSGTQAATPSTSAQTWHWSHTFTFPGRQVPPWQVSLRVQTSPSVHAVPFSRFVQVPEAGSQSWHCGHSTASGPCWHLPSASQMSAVHLLPVSHGSPGSGV